jgi:hypothetical protein
VPDITILEEAVLQNLQDVLGSEAYIERDLKRSRRSGKWSAKLVNAVSDLHKKTAHLEELLSMLEQHPAR